LLESKQQPNIYIKFNLFKSSLYFPKYYKLVSKMTTTAYIVDYHYLVHKKRIKKQ